MALPLFSVYFGLDIDLADQCVEAVVKKWSGNAPDVELTRSEDADLVSLDFSHSHDWAVDGGCRQASAELVSEHRGAGCRQAT